MAKKKYEFKPDPAGSGTLSKLYLTRKQRQSVLKWALYGLLCLAALILQDVILSELSLLGATTDLVSAAILLVCLLQGGGSLCPGWRDVLLFLRFLPRYLLYRAAACLRDPGGGFPAGVPAKGLFLHDLLRGRRAAAV